MEAAFNTPQLPLTSLAALVLLDADDDGGGAKATSSALLESLYVQSCRGDFELGVVVENLNNQK